MAAEKNTLFKDLWDLFCSLKLTVTTLLLLAATSVVGTLLPQNLDPDQYRQLFAGWVFGFFHGMVGLDPGQSWWLTNFPQSFADAAFNLVRAFQLYDMYHSWWFLGLLGVFALNLTACSLRRLPGVWRTATRPVLFPEDSLLRSLPNRQTLKSPFPLEETKARLEKAVRKGFARPRVSERDGAVGFFAQRHVYARFSVYVTHLSILLILFGAVIGSLWGFKSFVAIVEGETVDHVPSQRGDGVVPLGFSLRCDDFSISYYDEAKRRPREFRSVLTVLEGGRELPDLTRVPVLVNHPLNVKGLNFYQSSYDRTMIFRLSITPAEEGEESTAEGYPGQILHLPDGGSFRVIDFYPNYRDQGPAAILAVQDATGQMYGAVAPTTGPGPVMVEGAPYRFRLLGNEERFYTVLQVARDPGVYVVWAGCLLLVLGSLSAFFLSHRRLWLVIRPSGEGCEVKMAGSAHRNQPVMARQFQRLSRGIAAELGIENEQVSQEDNR